MILLAQKKRIRQLEAELEEARKECRAAYDEAMKYCEAIKNAPTQRIRELLVEQAERTTETSELIAIADMLLKTQTTIY